MIEARKVEILGSTWIIQVVPMKEDSKLEFSLGYTNFSYKRIRLRLDSDNETANSFSEMTNYYKSALRHEIIHAYHLESGLNDSLDFHYTQGFPEVLVDWFAIQSPKIFKTFQELGIL